MPICARCGKKFNYDDERDAFCEESLLNFETMKLSLCSKCALQAIEDQEDGIFTETCEKCGKTFDPVEDEGEFYSHLRDDPFADYHMYGYCLCAECAFYAYTDSSESENND